MELSNMFIRLGYKDAGWIRGVQKAEKKTHALQKSVKTLGRSMVSLKHIAITAFAGWGVSRVAKGFVEAASAAEGYQTRLTVLLRSQSEGNRLFEEMAEYAGRVPFEYEKVMASATALAGVMKGGVDEIKQWMPMIGDLAAVTGLSIEETTSQVIRMYSAGAAAADMFRERGVLSMLGFQAGVKYSAEETRQIMMREWQKSTSQFHGATNELADDWSGLVSMMKDAWFKFRVDVMGAGLFNAMKQGVQEILDTIKELKRTGELDKWAKQMAGRVLDAISLMVQGFGELKKAIVGFRSIFGVLVEYYAKLQLARLKFDKIFASKEQIADIEKLTAEYKIMQEAGKAMAEGNIKAMAESAEKIKAIRDKIAELKTGMDNTSKAADKTGNKIKDLGNKAKLTAAEIKKLNEQLKIYKEWEDEYIKKIRDVFNLRFRHGAGVKYISEEEWEKLFGAGGEVDQTLTTFLERTQGNFADTFNDIFSGQFDSFKDLMENMKDLLISTLAEMAAKAAASKLFSSAGSGSSDSGSSLSTLGYVGAIAGTVVGVANMLSGSNADERRAKRRARAMALAQAYKNLDEYMERATASLTDWETVVQSIDDKIKELRDSFSSLGGGITAVLRLEDARIALLAKEREEFKKSFEEPLLDMIQSFKLPGLEYELVKLDAWYQKQLVNARALGEESTKLLREAYELAKQQHFMAVRESLLAIGAESTSGLAMLSMTPIEAALYQLEQNHQAVIDSLGESSGKVILLEAQIADGLSEIISLQQEYANIENGLAAAQAAFAQAQQDVLTWYQQNSDNTAAENQMAVEMMTSLWTRFADVGFLVDKSINPLAYELQQTWLAIGEAEEALTYAGGSILGEISAINAALDTWQAELDATTGALTDAEAATLAFYEAQKLALIDQVQGGIFDIIQQYTLTDQELKQLALDEWYAEQLAAHIALGLAIDDLNHAYELQETAIWNVTDATGELTSALDGAIQSIRDMINELTGGSLAPVQSAAFYQTQYSGLLSAAQTAESADAIAQAVSELNAFIPTYLDFMGNYGASYADLTASIVSDLEGLLGGMPTAQHGTITTGPTIAGEHGPELVAPLYEPELSNFLQSLGTGGGETHIHLEVDGREIAYVISKQLKTNPELINTVRRVTH